MEQLAVMRGGHRRRLPVLGHLATVQVAGMVAVGLVVLPFLAPHTSSLAVLSFLVAVCLCAVRFGLRGGVVSALVGVGVAGVWLGHGHYAGWVAFAWHVATFMLVGCLVGAAVSDRNDLELAVVRHSELTLDLMCTASYDGYFVRVNPAWTRTLGYDAAELESRPFLDFVHPDAGGGRTPERARRVGAELPKPVPPQGRLVSLVGMDVAS